MSGQASTRAASFLACARGTNHVDGGVGTKGTNLDEELGPFSWPRRVECQEDGRWTELSNHGRQLEPDRVPVRNGPAHAVQVVQSAVPCHPRIIATDLTRSRQRSGGTGLRRRTTTGFVVCRLIAVEGSTLSSAGVVHRRVAARIVGATLRTTSSTCCIYEHNKCVSWLGTGACVRIDNTSWDASQSEVHGVENLLVTK
jgi:hypothetical protein